MFKWSCWDSTRAKKKIFMLDFQGQHSYLYYFFSWMSSADFSFLSVRCSQYFSLSN